jgi:hypothetical protein
MNTISELHRSTREDVGRCVLISGDGSIPTRTVGDSRLAAELPFQA